MRHIHDLHFSSYRGIKDLEINDLGQFNILIGKNNVGKTSVLEGVELVSRPGDIGQFVITARGRDRRFMISTRNRTSLVDSILWAFPTKRLGEIDVINREEINLSAFLDSGEIEYNIQCNETTVIQFKNEKNNNKNIESEAEEVRALELSLVTKVLNESINEEHIVTDGSFYMRNNRQSALAKTVMVTPVDHRVLPLSAQSLSRSIMRGNKNALVKLLKDFDENIEGIELLALDGNVPTAYFKHNLMGYVPISVFGDGVRRVLTVANAILQCKDGVLLIDEVETAIHAKLLRKFFDWLVETCQEYNVQVIATTHSIEAIDAILSADKEQLSDLKMYRLVKDQINETTRVKRFSGEDLYTLRFDLGQDVR